MSWSEWLVLVLWFLGALLAFTIIRDDMDDSTPTWVIMPTVVAWPLFAVAVLVPLAWTAGSGARDRWRGRP